MKKVVLIMAGLLALGNGVSYSGPIEPKVEVQNIDNKDGFQDQLDIDVENETRVYLEVPPTAHQNRVMSWIEYDCSYDLLKSCLLARGVSLEGVDELGLEFDLNTARKELKGPIYRGTYDATGGGIAGWSFYYITPGDKKVIDNLFQKINDKLGTTLELETGRSAF
jgi:hypothetical protein